MSDGRSVVDIANTPASVSEVQDTAPAPFRETNLWNPPQQTSTPQAQSSKSQSQSQSTSGPGGKSGHPLDFDVETDRIKLTLSDATDLLTGAATVVALIQ